MGEAAADLAQLGELLAGAQAAGLAVELAQPRGHLVERGDGLAHLAGSVGRGQAQLPLADLAGGGGEVAQRPGEAVGDGDAEQERAAEEAERGEQEAAREPLDGVLDAGGGDRQPLRGARAAQEQDAGGHRLEGELHLVREHLEVLTLALALGARRGTGCGRLAARLGSRALAPQVGQRRRSVPGLPGACPGRGLAGRMVDDHHALLDPRHARLALLDHPRELVRRDQARRAQHAQHVAADARRRARQLPLELGGERAHQHPLAEGEERGERDDQGDEPQA